MALCAWMALRADVASTINSIAGSEEELEATQRTTELHQPSSGRQRAYGYGVKVHACNKLLCNADRIGVIAKGRLLAEGTLDDLRYTSRGSSLEEIFLELVAEDEDGGMESPRGEASAAAIASA